MLLVTENGKVNRSLGSKRWLFFTAFLGVVLLIIPILIFFVDPIFVIVQYKLRLENSSMIYDLLTRRFTSTKMYLYIFNVTNAERFISGDDHKIKLQEIGPFVYQEYRTIEDLEINKDPGIMRYTPKLETEFILEESIGDPKELNITVPNLSVLAAASLISKYSYLVRQIFNIVAAGNKVTAFIELRAYDYFWGYSNPLIQLGNNVVPGLVYFKSIGILERIYDVGVDYRYDISTRYYDKFSVQRATKIQTKKEKTDSNALVDNIFTFNHTYEGAAFPPGLTSDTPIHIYRHGLCKTFHMHSAHYHPYIVECPRVRTKRFESTFLIRTAKEWNKLPAYVFPESYNLSLFRHVGSSRMYYGGDAFVYHFHNDTFNDKAPCDSKGWCPEGLKDISRCFFGLPLALSKSHFLDCDSRLLDKVEGLKPDRKFHDSEVVIDPKLGMGISGKIALQMSLILGDTSFNPETRRLKDTVLPVANIIAKSPPVIEEVRSVLHLMHSSGPYIKGVSQVICVIIGLYLMSYTIRMLYRIWLARYEAKRKDCKKTNMGQWPLLLS